MRATLPKTPAVLPNRTLTKYRYNPFLQITMAAFNTWSTDLVVKATFYGKLGEYVACYFEVRDNGRIKAAGHAHALGKHLDQPGRAMILAIKSCGIFLSQEVDTCDKKGTETIIKAIGIALGHDPSVLRLRIKTK